MSHVYNGSVIVALADVQHIEKWDKHTAPGIMVVTSHTKWNFEHDIWENAIWISEPEAALFRDAWIAFRAEDTQAPRFDIMGLHDRTMTALKG